MTLLIADHGPVRLLTLHRPEARNALSSDLVRRLDAALIEADADLGVRAVVLTGSDPAFCAGVDLKEASRPDSDLLGLLHRTERVGQPRFLAKPLIGAINGPAITGGLEVALGCDFLIASDRAVFADTHGQVGLVPVGGMTIRLPRVVGMAMAKRLSLTGELVHAEAALRIGLVTEVVAHQLLLARALAVAATMAAWQPAALAAIKDLYEAAWTATPLERHALERTIAQTVEPEHDLDQARAAVRERNSGQLSTLSRAQ